MTASKEKFGELIHANDHELTSRVLKRVWAEAERISGKTSIGLLVAHGTVASSLLGLLFYRAMAAESLGHAIQETLVDRQALSVAEHVRWQGLRDGSYALGIDHVGSTARCSPSRAEFTQAVVLKLLEPVLATDFPIGAGLSMVSRVQSAIHEALPTGDTARAHIASRLRLSESTLAAQVGRRQHLARPSAQPGSRQTGAGPERTGREGQIQAG